MTKNQTNNGNSTAVLVGAGVLGALVVGGIIYLLKDEITEVVTETVENNLGFEVKKVGFTLGFPFIVLPVDFEISNDNLIDTSSVTFLGAAYYEGIKVADILEVEIVDIPAKSFVEGRVEAIVDLRKLETRLIEIFSQGRFSKQLEIRGKINSSFGEFQVSRKVDVDV